MLSEAALQGFMVALPVQAFGLLVMLFVAIALGVAVLVGGKEG